MIDLACSVATLDALPVAELLRATGADAGLARLIESSLLRDGDPDPGLAAIAEGAAMPAPIEPAPRPGGAGVDEQLSPAALAAIVAELPASAFVGASFVEVVAASDPRLLGALMTAPRDDASDWMEELVRRRRAVAAALEHTCARTAVSPVIARLLRRRGGERRAVAAALAEGAGLVAGHGVDLEHLLGATPRRPLDTQLARLRALAMCGAGRVVVFVPCDPFRPESTGVVREALRRGFAGVTIHAPPPFPARPVGIGPAEPVRRVQARLVDVLREAVDAGAGVVLDFDGWLPLLSDVDVQAACAWWAEALTHRRLRSLRVCLAHDRGAAPEALAQPARAASVALEQGIEALVGTRPDIVVCGRRGAAAVAVSTAGDRRDGRSDRSRAGTRSAGNHPGVQAALAFLDLDGFLRRCGEALGEAERDGLARIARGESIEPIAPAASTPASDPTPSRRAAVSTRRRGGATRRSAPTPRGGMALARSSTSRAPWDSDCIIIGAGIAGLAAADTLVRPRARWATPRRVIVVEAADRIGGRIHTSRSLADGPIELGAELIHRPAHDQLLGGFSLWDDIRRHGLAVRAIHKLQGAHVYFPAWKSEGPALRSGCAVCGDPDVARAMDVLSRIAAWNKSADARADEEVTRLLAQHAEPRRNAEAMCDLLLTGTVPGRLHELSVAGLAADKVKDQELSTEEYHVDDGYDLLPRALARDLDVRTGFRVTRISYGPAGVEVESDDGITLRARCAICTVSVGILKANAIGFEPPLPPGKGEALDQVENGPISKVVLRFERSFWPANLSLLGNPGSHRRAGRSYFAPLYGSSGRDPVLTALFNGNEARELDRRMAGHAEADSSGTLPEAAHRAVDAYIRNEILHDLAQMGWTRPVELRGWHVRSWANDPLTLGGTSFIRHQPGMTSHAVRRVREALADHLDTLPLYWAGEATATGTNPWSVHGAHQSGRDAARKVDAFLDLPTG